MIKLIASDLDGTLLASDHQVSTYSKAILQEFMKNGMKVVLISGRPYQHMMQAHDALELDQYDSMMIAQNGAVIYDCKKKEVIQQIRIPKKEVSEVALRLEKIDLPFSAYDGVDVYTNDQKTYEGHMQRKSFNPHLCKAKDLNICADKMSVSLADTALQQKVRDEFTDHDAVFFVNPTWIEIAPRTISKGNTLEKLCNMLQIGLDEVYAFGDGENDISFFKKVRYSIAMGNAMDRLKDIAYDVCGSNDEDGLANYLKEHLSIKG